MFTIAFCFIVSIVSIFSIYCRYKKENWYFFAKPIPLFLMIVFLSIYMISRDQFTSLNTWVLFGLVFGLLGDIFLLKENLFIFGLLAFLTGHIGYILGFVSLSNQYDTAIFGSSIFLAFLYTIFLFQKIFQNKKDKYLLPVIIYAIAISVMAASGLNLDKQLKNDFPYFSIGVLLFSFSDGVWSYNKFVKQFYLSQIFILSSYYSAQAFFCIGIFNGL